MSIPFLSSVQMPDRPEFRRGVGTGSQLAYGEATGLNAQAQVARQTTNVGAGAGTAGPQTAPVPAQQQLPPERSTMSDSDFNWLLSGGGAGGGGGTIASLEGNVEAWRPILSMSASLPGAAPTLKTLNARVLMALGPL